MLNIYFRIVLQSTAFTAAHTQVPDHLPYEKFYHRVTCFATFEKFYILPVFKIGFKQENWNRGNGATNLY